MSFSKKDFLVFTTLKLQKYKSNKTASLKHYLIMVGHRFFWNLVSNTLLSNMSFFYRLKLNISMDMQSLIQMVYVMLETYSCKANILWLLQVENPLSQMFQVKIILSNSPHHIYRGLYILYAFSFYFKSNFSS